MSDRTGETRIPVVEERARIDKRVVPTGRVRIKVKVDEKVQLLSEELTAQSVIVDRVQIDREVEAPPPIRTEGDLLIIPVVEQRLVIEKRWVVVEEVHVRQGQSKEAVELPVKLRSTRVSVERDTMPEGEPEHESHVNDSSDRL
jgi:stress response protein YsnF